MTSRSTSSENTVTEVSEVEGISATRHRESFERQLREERILARLRGALKQSRTESDEEDPDRYEPQRLTRKMCWQYDGQARRVTFLRRPYI